MTSAVNSPLVEIRNLTKRFGTRPVLNGVDLDIHRGQVMAVIGPNGAGKTTLNKCLLGLVRPDSGSIRFDGVDTAGRTAHRARIGYMPQTPRYPDAFTAGDVLALLDDLRGARAPRDEGMLQAMHVTELLAQPARVLSGGQRQRLNAAAAFLFAPSLLLLDEPTAGLDPVASGLLKDRIRGDRDQGRAVVITSHILSELQELADVIVFLFEGQVQYVGALDELLEYTRTTTLERAVAALMLLDPAAGRRVRSA